VNLSFDGFRDSIEVLQRSEADDVRVRFVEAFVDSSDPGFVSTVQSRTRFSDGSWYTGYLWDYMVNREFIGLRKALSVVKTHGTVLVFWDLHSAERIRIPGYWRFERDAVLRMPGSLLELGLQWLPEDLYIHDHSLGWAIALTHEYVDEQRWCIRSRRGLAGRNPPPS
jgi:hypothetical protein